MSFKYLQIFSVPISSQWVPMLLNVSSTYGICSADLPSLPLVRGSQLGWPASSARVSCRESGMSFISLAEYVIVVLVRKA